MSDNHGFEPKEGHAVHKCFSCKAYKQFEILEYSAAFNSKTDVCKGICPDCGKKICRIIAKSQPSPIEEEATSESVSNEEA